MNCRDWEERVVLDAGGDLTGLEAEEAARHLADCPGCRAFSSRLKDTLAELREAHTNDVAAAHFTAVRAAVLAEIERRRRGWRRLVWVSAVGVAAAVVLGLALRPGLTPPPPAQVALGIPAAPPAPIRSVTVMAQPHKRSRPRRPRTPSAPLEKRRQPETAPLLVKWQTADPNIVIYWTTGDN
jgi:hypothetical protein